MGGLTRIKTAAGVPSCKDFRGGGGLKAPGTSLIILLLAALWAPSASAYKAYSCDGSPDTDPGGECYQAGLDSGYCADCHGNFGELLIAGPGYASPSNNPDPNSPEKWHFQGDPNVPVSLHDFHAGFDVATPPGGGVPPELDCDSCHTYYDAPPPVRLRIPAPGPGALSCISCHTDLLASHRAAAGLQWFVKDRDLPAERLTCAGGSLCHGDGGAGNDSDGDGILDANDQCPATGDQGYGVDATGCPNPPTDGDGDGVMDNDDQCPATGDQGYGVDATGCPNPPTDGDGDGVMDNDDQCPATG
ncbi:MAG TPA: hypothetical protein ENI99_04420, partial [Sedimenticola sp.]|nr:hypothetical protein [Sedimenticola sp.]